MEKDGSFVDFDDEGVYKQSQLHALNESTRNFVVEFGKDSAQIAFDLGVDDVRTFLGASRQAETPVRWINIWAPNRQVDIIDELFGKHYKFSPRLLAIIRTTPIFDTNPRSQNQHVGPFKAKMVKNDDIELATPSIDTPRAASPTQNLHNTSHYAIAKQMLNYQSVDVGPRFLCVGANWMHEVPGLTNDESIGAEGSQRRLWSWLVLCDDNTVISVHEDAGHLNNVDEIKSIRGNTLSVLSQLSKFGHLGADPISMQTVRQALLLDAAHLPIGVDGASNLFYYLFDDWRAVYSTIATYRQRLERLQTAILDDIGRKSLTTPNIEIIPRLHSLGKHIRQMQHLYTGYKNIIQRILEPKSTAMHEMNLSRSQSSLSALPRGVVLAQSAAQRFERLGDRIQLLILSETQEFLAEKDALVSTYFNINAQKDSEATARLTRSATLLAKLSVLFLPVSLMTSYFSVQISDLEGIYTSKDYWYTFAVIMSISFMFLFFFSRLLMWVTETLDGWVKNAGKYVGGMLRRRRGEDGHGR